MKWKIFIVFLISFIGAQAQVEYTKTHYKIYKSKTVKPSNENLDFEPKVTNLEMPQPGSSKFALEELKKQSALLFPRVEKITKSWEVNNETELTINEGWPLSTIFILPNGDTLFQFLGGGIPNDNTLAISNDGLLFTAYNSSVFAFDTNADTLLFKNSLHNFSSEFTLNDKYDPKTLYDPINDRFILVFLNGRLSTNMRIIICFSSTNNPNDPWFLYEVPGNPLNDTTWTDYPAIAITKNELFLTGNLLRDNQSWQTGFSQTIIWQIGLNAGYTGDTILDTKLWTDIKYDGVNIRNLNPIQGGSTPLDSVMHLLSNRNFTIQSDSMFLIKVNGTNSNPQTDLTIDLGLIDTPYGAPPNGRQKSGEDPLATNDARVLGGFIENGEIQFVANTINPANGFAGVYHGFISNLNSTPVFEGTILSDDSLDFGYPNIVYTGNSNCSRQSVIAFNHTSPWHFAGASSIGFNTDGTYTNLTNLTSGEAAIDRLNGSERWGDYFGIQRKYNTPTNVWTAAFFSKSNGSNYTWVSSISAPEEVPFSASITNSTNLTSFGANDGSASATAIGGVPPYNYHWSDNSTSETSVNLRIGQHFITISDSKNCEAIDSVSIEQPAPKNASFPNPTNNLLNVYFTMDKAALTYIFIYDDRGRIATKLFEDLVKEGENIFTFSTYPLATGTYFLRIFTEDEIIITEKIIKVNDEQ